MRRSSFSLGLLVALSILPVFGQNIVTTIAGTDFRIPDGTRDPLRTPLSYVAAMAQDRQGNVYLADSQNQQILKLTPEGAITIVAGNGIGGHSGDGGPATRASIHLPLGVAVAPDGAVYFSESDAYIRRIDVDGTISTVAGTGWIGNTKDGVLAATANIEVGSIAIDASGVIAFVERRLNRVRKILPDGRLATVAGTGTAGFSGDGGQGAKAALSLSNTGNALAFDGAGNLYIADYFNCRVRKVAADGVISTFAGSSACGYSGDGRAASSARLGGPTAIGWSSSGLLIGDTSNRVRQVNLSGIISTVAGNGTDGYTGDGDLALRAMIEKPAGLTALNEGGFLVAAADTGHVRKVGADGFISTVAGNNLFSFAGDGGPAVDANLRHPMSVAVAPSGDLYIADTDNNRVRKVSAGVITTVAGNGVLGYAGDGGPAVEAQLNYPTSVALDRDGNLYIADTNNLCIRKVDTKGIITTVAGGGESVKEGDTALNSLISPSAITFDPAGNLVMADTAAVLRLNADQTITTLAGQRTSQGNSGDEGPATKAKFQWLTCLAYDADGNLYVCDAESSRVRKITPDGIIHAFAGTGVFNDSSDGILATKAAMAYPMGIAVDIRGNVFIADMSANRIRAVDTTGVIWGFAGSGNVGYCCDGLPPQYAQFDGPIGLAFDSARNFYIVDYYNNRIRAVLFSSPEFRVDSAPLAFTGRAGGAPTDTIRATAVGGITGLRFSVTAEYTDGADWLTLSSAAGQTPRLIDISADPGKLAAGTYHAAVTFKPSDITAPAVSIPVTFTVGEAAPATLTVDRASFSFTLPKGASGRSDTLKIGNSGSGSISFTTAFQSKTGGDWLSVTPASGAATSRDPVTLSASADPAGLAPGTYTGTLAIRSDAGSKLIPVTLTISSRPQAMLLTLTGASFSGVSGGGLTPPQTFGVVNLGTGSMAWNASATTLSGGDWLSVTPDSGTTQAGAAAPTPSIRVNAKLLEPGKYYGQIRVTADPTVVANSPQVITVALQVLPPGSNPGAVVQPSELVFYGPAPGVDPSSQDLLVYNPAGDPVSLYTNVQGDDQKVAFDYRPRTQSVRPDEALRIAVGAYTMESASGDHTGNLALQFSDGSVREVKLKYVVGGAARGATTKAMSPRADSGCKPTRLVPSLVSLGQGSSVPAGWPAGIMVQVADDCGASVSTGAVVASFSNSDTGFQLDSLNDGRWQGTMTTKRGPSAKVNVTVLAVSASGALRGVLTMPATLTDYQDPPVSSEDQVFVLTTDASYQPLAPGAIVRIHGDRLAETSETASDSPLPSTLGNARVQIAGLDMPLLSASATDLRAIVPYTITPSTRHQIVLRRGLTYSQPISVDVAPTQPGVVTADGSTQAVATVVRGETQFDNSAAAPARPGDKLIVYAAGLGLVSPAVDTGTMGPADPLSVTVAPVEVRLGDAAVPDAVASLAPGRLGIYQIVMTIPAGAPDGLATPVTVTMAGQSSPPATVAIGR